MTVNFPKEKWAPLHETYTKWWRRELERPIINLVIHGAPAQEKKPEGYRHTALWNYPKKEDVDEYVDKYLTDVAYTLSSELYAADGFPLVQTDYGAGVNAAFFGAKTEVRESTVWFLPPAPDIDIQKFHLIPNRNCWEYRMIRRYYEKASKLFDGRVILGETYMHNGIDTVSRFFEGEDILMALYDYPGDVKRLIEENHNFYHLFAKEFHDVTNPPSPGRSGWGGLLGGNGTQSDFCAMIGPDMFRDFILPELELCWKKDPERSWYHLDGPGELPHLDMILESPLLRGMQWVPSPNSSEGKPLPIRWKEIYKRFYEAGKNQWFTGSLEEVEMLADMGMSKGLFWSGSVSYGKETEKALRILERLKVPSNI
jgi:5-methyltetrahydrofolate--homocysteine methyltransferase